MPTSQSDCAICSMAIYRLRSKRIVDWDISHSNSDAYEVRNFVGLHRRMRSHVPHRHGLIHSLFLFSLVSHYRIVIYTSFVWNFIVKFSSHFRQKPYTYTSILVWSMKFTISDNPPIRGWSHFVTYACASLCLHACGFVCHVPAPTDTLDAVTVACAMGVENWIFFPQQQMWLGFFLPFFLARCFETMMNTDVHNGGLVCRVWSFGRSLWWLIQQIFIDLHIDRRVFITTYWIQCHIHVIRFTVAKSVRSRKCENSIRTRSETHQRPLLWLENSSCSMLFEQIASHKERFHHKTIYRLFTFRAERIKESEERKKIRDENERIQCRDIKCYRINRFDRPTQFSLASPRHEKVEEKNKTVSSLIK